MFGATDSNVVFVNRRHAEGVSTKMTCVNRAIWRLFKEKRITIPVAQHEVVLQNALPDLD